MDRLTPEEKHERHKARCRAYYRQNKARLIACQAARRRADPDARKPHDAAYRNRHAEKVMAAKEAYRVANLEKVRAAKARWRRENAEKMQAARLRWEANNPERKRMHRENRRARERSADGQMSADIVQRLLESQDGKCACCATALDGKGTGRYKSRCGGANDDNNAQLLCRTCNRKKGRKLPQEFVARA